MKYPSGTFVTAAVLLSSGVYGAPQASSSVTLNTPTNLVTCEPVMLTWSGGTAPYFLSLQDGNNFNGAALQRFDQQSGTTASWTVTVAAGKSVAFLLRDSSGQTSVTAPVTVQKGSQETCVDNTISFAASSGSPPSAAGGATSSVGGAPPKTTAGPVTMPGQSRSSSSSSSSPSKSAAVASTSSNAAPNLAVSGAVVPALAALFGFIMA